MDRFFIESGVQLLPDDISFDEWAKYVFDHPVEREQWWFRQNDPGFAAWNEDADRERTLAYLTQLFESPAFLMDRFTVKQIDQGFWFLLSCFFSDHLGVLLETTIPWERRRHCLHAIRTLYSGLFAPLHGDRLGHCAPTRDPEGQNSSCYMFWDLISISPEMNHPQRDQFVLAGMHVFERTLELKSEACLESVLHGLGHWHAQIPERTEPMIREFLKRRPDISPELRHYAECAALGQVQ